MSVVGRDDSDQESHSLVSCSSASGLVVLSFWSISFSNGFHAGFDLFVPSHNSFSFSSHALAPFSFALFYFPTSFSYYSRMLQTPLPLSSSIPNSKSSLRYSLCKGCHASWCAIGSECSNTIHPSSSDSDVISVMVLYSFPKAV